MREKKVHFLSNPNSGLFVVFYSRILIMFVKQKERERAQKDNTENAKQNDLIWNAKR